MKSLKGWLTTTTLAAVMVLGSTVANAGIIFGKSVADSPCVSPTTTQKTDTGIIFGKSDTGIIFGKSDTGIIFGKSDTGIIFGKDGIIFGRNGIIFGLTGIIFGEADTTACS